VIDVGCKADGRGVPIPVEVRFGEGMEREIIFLCTSIYIKLPRLSLCVSVFRISQKHADRFP